MSAVWGKKNPRDNNEISFRKGHIASAFDGTEGTIIWKNTDITSFDMKSD